jgi:hypothetical protein
MQRTRVLFLLMVICAILITPVLAATDWGTPDHVSPVDQYVTRSYDYVLDGKQDSLSLALSMKLHKEYLGKEPQGFFPDNRSYFLAYMNDPDQQPYIKTLADEIRAETGNTDDQARIATSLVQHITFENGSKYRYPYEVLYEGSGVCGEKSILLATLLRELGYRSSIMYFIPENHMTAGISCPSPFDFKGSGYCMIETTHAVIITDETSFMSSGQTGWSIPEITQTSEGISFNSVKNEYYDARTGITLQSKIKTAQDGGRRLPSSDIHRWYELQSKYDLS